MSLDEQLKAKRKLRENLEAQLEKTREHHKKISIIEEENNKIREMRKQTSSFWRIIYGFKELPSKIKRIIRGY